MGLPTLTAIILLNLGAALASPAAPGGAPKVRTEQLVAALGALQDPAVPRADRSPERQASTLEGYFDFDRLAQGAIAPHKASFKANQLAELTQIFRQLLVVSTSQSGAQLTHGKVAFAAPRPVGKGCVVGIAVSQPDDDMPAQVDFTWEKQRQGWKVVDVAFDGASIVKDYQNQFGRIIKKEGAQVLVSKMKERLAQAQKPSP